MSGAFIKPVVVIDNGSHSIKAGFACDNHPLSIFRNVVGRPNYLNGRYGKTPYDVYIGDEAMERTDELELNFPVVKGKIVHWDNMERVWHHVYYRELKAAPEDRAVLLSCASTTTIPDKVKCCEIFFETLNAPALCVKTQSELALFGSGLTTGLSIDMGEDVTQVNPIYEGGSISYAGIPTNVAGQEIKGLIQDSLQKRKIDLGLNPDYVIDDIFRKHVYITEYCAVTRAQYMKQYQLPDGKTINISDEAFLAGELCFQPELVTGEKSDKIAIQDAIVTSVMKCDDTLQSEMFEGMIVHGGMATMPGFVQRLKFELEYILNRQVNLIESPECYAVAWMGGAVFAGMSDAPKLWIHKRQFEEQGEKLVRNMFM